MYLGISQTHHAHMCFDPVQSKIFISHDVQFFGKEFPFKQLFIHFKKYTSQLSWEVIDSKEDSPTITQTTPLYSIPYSTPSRVPLQQ